MNTLESHFASNHLNEIATMNKLQEAGIVSDNAVLAADVSDGDCARAVKWLALQEGLLISDITQNKPGVAATVKIGGNETGYVATGIPYPEPKGRLPVGFAPTLRKPDMSPPRITAKCHAP